MGLKGKFGRISGGVKLPNHNPIEDLGDEVSDNVNRYRMTHLSLFISKYTEFGTIKMGL